MQFLGKKHISVFSHVCTLALAVPCVTVTLPHLLVVGAVKRVRKAPLLKRPGDRFMGSSAEVKGRKGAECGAQERAQHERLGSC